jgi:para-aminobenzoate synthetase component 1
MVVEPIALPSAEHAARALATRPGLAWLDGDGSEAEGRFSYVASDPVEQLARTLADDAPLDALARAERGPARERSGGTPRAPRWIGYIAYDAAWGGRTRVRRGIRIARDSNDFALIFQRYEAVVAFDHRTSEAFIIGDDTASCARLRARIDAGITTDFSFSLDDVAVPEGTAHEAAIAEALELIAAGEIYQVNLARRWTATLSGTGPRGAALGLYLAMRRASPVPLGAFLDAGDHAILSRTMERFLDWDGDALRTCPIKGTIRRSGRDDEAEASRLRGDAKERAEHAMIVDLMRNDLGRIAVTGSVHLPRLFAVEPYAGLSHLVSTVACRTRPGTTLDAILEATFPPGSVTGAPKIRAMEVIEALEPVPRGMYCGALGFIDREGGASLAVAIRTAIARAGQVAYHAGGGLVFASDPARELAETELKARAFLDAAGPGQTSSSRRGRLF